MRLKGCVRDIFLSRTGMYMQVLILEIGDGIRYLIVLQDFAEQHKHRAREVLGPNAGAEIIALGGAIGGVHLGGRPKVA